MSAIHPNPRGPESPATHADDPNLEHHFVTPAQQFDASKLGMWLFLVTEILFFSGLFCAYAVYRRRHPELFAYGSQFLDVRLGGLNTLVLITSSLTMALAVWSAQRGLQRQLVLFLQLTFLGGVAFLGIKYLEYESKFDEGLVWGSAFYQQPEWLQAEHTLAAARASLLREPAPNAPPALVAGDAELGRPLWNGVCRSCHGASGEGMPNEGKEIAGGAYVTSRSDQELLAFLKVGRLANDDANTTKKVMPPRGGNPLLSDQDLMHIIALVRTLPKPGADAAGTTTAPAAAEEFWIPRSVQPDLPSGPAGLRPEFLGLASVDPHHPVEHPHHTMDPGRPANAHIYFALYFCLTGLHGIHVIAGMFVLVWLITRASRGDFTAEYYTPVDLGGLYWHLVDLVWIYLFPLLYLTD